MHRRGSTLYRCTRRSGNAALQPKTARADYVARTALYRQLASQAQSAEIRRAYAALATGSETLTETLAIIDRSSQPPPEYARARLWRPRG